MLLVNLIVAIIFFQPIPPIPDAPEIPLVEVTLEVDALDTEVIPKNEIYTFLATAVAEVNSMPDDLAVNGGTELLPNESATQLFSYGRWLFSGSSATELLGETLAPIGINIYVYLTIMVVLTSAYFTIRVAALIIRFVQYVVGWVLKVIPFIG
jgi:hypothetical protein